ncbi:SDR family oxidoreductase [Arthrobacter sp. Soc17.1.1.1]|uniref:SDR family oxidoreductase n=1 Tax=Arthrobacter sp. Soc17.1.1.1 TaxID=3121277 RepID=UPI003FA5B3A8
MSMEAPSVTARPCGTPSPSRLGRVGHPEEIADAITALVSDNLRWVTGENVEVSGGVLI